MATAVKIKKMSTQSIAKIQKMVEDELNRRQERMEQLSEVRKHIAAAIASFGLAAEEVVDMFKVGRKSAVTGKKRGRKPGSKNATRKTAAAAAKKVPAKRGRKPAAKKAVRRGRPSARSAAMKAAWARRKAAKEAAEG